MISFRPVIHVDISQFETMMKNETSKHAHWVSLNSEFLRFTPVLKPILLITDGSAAEQQHQQIEVIFRKIEPEISEYDASKLPLQFSDLLLCSSTKTATESGDGSASGNTTEVVRYIRRRKFGRKRRSYYVKYRVSNKVESSTTRHEDEHSQEYISRRRDSSAAESPKEEDGEEEEGIKTPPTASPPSPLFQSPSNQPKFKQLTLDQFLKKIPSVKENASENSTQNTTTEEPVPEVKNEEFRIPRRTKRLSSAHISKSETDLVKMVNGASEDTLKKPVRKSFFIYLEIANNVFCFS